MPYTPDLFASDATEGAMSEFEHAFRAWLASGQQANRLRRDSTWQVYEDMWGAFAAWCLGQSPTVTLANVHSLDLQRFLDSRHGTERGQVLTARYAWRMLSLIDRVQAHRASVIGEPKNEAAAELIQSDGALRRANISERPGVDYLDAEQARRLVSYLGEVRPGATARRPLSGWQALRNLTAVALHLGAGLTPGDVRELPLDAPVTAGGRFKGVPWKLLVPGNGNRPARETPVAPWAGQLLKYWLSVRAQAGLPEAAGTDRRGRPAGPFLLPGRSGQQWGKVAHYEGIREVMIAAGIDDADSSSGAALRLRHTFAIRQLRRKKAAADVARWMGIAHTEEMARYERVLDAYEEAA